MIQSRSGDSRGLVSLAVTRYASLSPPSLSNLYKALAINHRYSHDHSPSLSLKTREASNPRSNSDVIRLNLLYYAEPKYVFASCERANERTSSSRLPNYSQKCSAATRAPLPSTFASNQPLLPFPIPDHRSPVGTGSLLGDRCANTPYARVAAHTSDTSSVLKCPGMRDCTRAVVLCDAV